MNSLAIWQQHNTQVSTVHFSDSSPPTNSTIGLDLLSFRSLDDALNPLIFDQRAVGPGPHRQEIICRLQYALSMLAEPTIRQHLCIISSTRIRQLTEIRLELLVFWRGSNGCPHFPKMNKGAWRSTYGRSRGNPVLLLPSVTRPPHNTTGPINSDNEKPSVGAPNNSHSL